MRKVIIVLLIVAMLFLVAADKPPKPPKVLRLTIVNRAGEDVRVSLTGLGYDFQTGEFIDGWGAISPQFYSTLVPGTLTVNKNVILKLPEYIAYMDVLKDLYVLDLQYNREVVPEESNAASVICLNTWVPPAYYGDPTYYAVRGGNARLVIKPCNQVPVNLGAPGEGILKYNRYMILLATSGYGFLASGSR